MTATLHIEHAITDYPTWKTAFDRFADARAQAGVTAHRIRVLEEDPRQILIDLDFDAAAAAHAFAAFLHERVWGTGNAPALAGTPTTRVLLVEECVAQTAAAAPHRAAELVTAPDRGTRPDSTGHGAFSVPNGRPDAGHPGQRGGAGPGR